jgi:hypothetical protein
MMRLMRYQFIIGISLITISTSMLYWGLIPPETIVQVSRLTNADIAFQQDEDINQPTEDNETPSNNDPAIRFPEQVIGKIQMEWPESVRVSDLVEMRLIFLPESIQKNTGDAPNVSPNDILEQEPSLAPILSAHLELAEIAQKPSGVISQPLSLDHPVTFLWRLRAARTGVFSGDLWLTAVPGSSINDESVHKVILNRPVIITAKRFMGLSGVESRVLGVLCAFVGLSLILRDYYSARQSHITDHSA